MKNQTFKIFKDKTGALIPFYLKNILKLSIEKVLFMAIKDFLEQIMRIKNVIKY